MVLSLAVNFSCAFRPASGHLCVYLCCTTSRLPLLHVGYSSDTVVSGGEGEREICCLAMLGVTLRKGRGGGEGFVTVDDHNAGSQWRKESERSCKLDSRERFVIRTQWNRGWERRKSSQCIAPEEMKGGERCH
jgi:hypothetical protein